MLEPGQLASSRPEPRSTTTGIPPGSPPPPSSWPERSARSRGLPAGAGLTGPAAVGAVATPAQGRQLRHVDTRHEATYPVVGRVHLQEQGRVCSQGALVVRWSGPVGRADFDEPGAGGLEDLGYAESPADLDQLAPAHDHLPVGCQAGQHEEDGSRPVVDDQGGLGAGGFGE